MPKRGIIECAHCDFTAADTGEMIGHFRQQHPGALNEIIRSLAHLRGASVDRAGIPELPQGHSNGRVGRPASLATGMTNS